MIVELYSGIRGPGIAMERLGLGRAIGFEWDARACASSAAAGHLTVRADIGGYPVESLAEKVTGAWASPPCQTFSRAGKGAGNGHLARILEQIEGGDWSIDGLDEKTAHVLHVGRWIETLNPEWVCMEQVPGVQPAWDAYARLLDARGYSCWTGRLNAADFGTAQSRIRSMFAASRLRQVEQPEPTHAGVWTPMSRVVDLSPEAELIPGSWADGRGGNRRRYRAHTEPAPTLHFGHDAAAWKWAEDGQLRRVLPGEALRLQGFPSAYPLAGPLTAQYLQIANACPPELAGAVLEVAT